MSNSYQAIIAASGMTERKWRLVRQACRAQARERGEDVMAIYAREGVLTPREKQTLADPECAEKRKVWRTNKKLAAENASLKNILNDLLCEAEDVFNCMADMAGIDRHSYPEPYKRARAALTEQGEK